MVDVGVPDAFFLLLLLEGDGVLERFDEGLCDVVDLEECLLDDLSRDLLDPDGVCCGAGECCLGDLSLLAVSVVGGDILRGSDGVFDDDGDAVLEALDFSLDSLSRFLFSMSRILFLSLLIALASTATASACEYIKVCRCLISSRSPSGVFFVGEFNSATNDVIFRTISRSLRSLAIFLCVEGVLGS